jgi:hypothetical protein
MVLSVFLLYRIVSLLLHILDTVSHSPCNNNTPSLELDLNGALIMPCHSQRPLLVLQTAGTATSTPTSLVLELEHVLIVSQVSPLTLLVLQTAGTAATTPTAWYWNWSRLVCCCIALTLVFWHATRWHCQNNTTRPELELDSGFSVSYAPKWCGFLCTRWDCVHASARLPSVSSTALAIQRHHPHALFWICKALK